MTETTTIRGAMARREAASAAYNDEAPGGVLGLRPEQTWWTARQAAALRALGITNATEEDLLVFFHYCQKTQLDPFSKQIYLIERRSKVDGKWVYRQVIVIGIDGYRLNAQRAADKRGVVIDYEDPTWFDDDGKKYEVWLRRDKTPAAARVTVIKKYPDGRTSRFPAVAIFEDFADYAAEYKDNKPTGGRTLKAQWGVMPAHMIRKVAEAQALRMAFPHDLGGTYAEEEMQGAWEAPPPKLPARQRDPAPGDDSVVPGAVEPQVPPASPEPPPPDAYPAPKASMARITAAFRKHDLAAKGDAPLRRAVVTGVLHGDGEQWTGYADLQAMTPGAVAAAADAVAAWLAGLDYIQAPNGQPYPVRQQITDYADRVDVAIAEWEQARNHQEDPK